MKRTFLLYFLMLLTGTLLAQSQQGYVKTKGRMVNGQHVKGEGLKGAVVALHGRSAVGVQNADGSFSFPVVGKSYTVQSVTKNGYQLVDADAAPKAYAYSTNPIYLVMETPEQQQADKVAAERKLRRTLQQQLQKREEEIDAMKVSMEEKNRLLAELYKNQENNEKLIADMAKEYAAMDYDQMDEMNRRVSDAILNGRLTEADSLLRSKGDMKSRDAEIERRLHAEAQEKAELAARQESLAASEAGTRKLMEDFANDCYKYYEMFKLQNQYDSAAYYIEKRALRDTTNAEWQFHAAIFLHEQKQFHRVEPYYLRALRMYRRLAQQNPQAYEPYVAMTLNNLATLYNQTQRFTESEAIHKEALEIRRRLAQQNPQTYETDVAQTLINLANLNYKTQRFTEGEAMYKEALETYRRLAQQNPHAYELYVATTLNNLATLYYETQRFTESETMYKEALEIRRRLAQQNPQAYEPDVAQTLNDLANLYSDTQRFTESEATYKEVLEICRRLAQQNPQTFEPGVAQTLGGLSFCAILMKKFAESERYAREGLAVDSTQHWIATNLAAALLFQGKYAEAEKFYRQYKGELKDSFLNDFKQFAEAGVIPKEREADVEKIKKMLNE